MFPREKLSPVIFRPWQRFGLSACSPAMYRPIFLRFVVLTVWPLSKVDLARGTAYVTRVRMPTDSTSSRYKYI